MSESQPLSITEAAFARVHSLMTNKGSYNLKLRIYIIGGGCAGFQYGFKFVEEAEPEDVHMTFHQPQIDLPITVVVDHMSLMYLTGSIVDYKVSLRGSQFFIQNPNAQTTCGCGSSFSLNI